MKTKIQKWGNSLGVRLPKSIAEQKDLRAGTGVNVSLKDDQIVIEAAEDETASLDVLLQNVTEENLHGEYDWGPTQGKEVW